MHRAVKTDGRTAIAAATRGPRRYTSEFVPGGHSVTKTVRVTVTGNIMQITNKLEVGPIKMVNDIRYYRALESASIASALSTALTIYPCQIRVHQR